jgi:NMD protein affecting ribosome stability and mRNA decay
VETDRSLEDDEIGVVCTDCAYETRKSVGWLRAHTQVECPGCGAIIDVESRNFRKIPANGGPASEAED